MSPGPRELCLLTGPTASGKTDLALRWAEAHGAEILSCDSLLFYRGMDIGTAKPTAQDQARVPHHLVDVRHVDQPMNVADYAVLGKAAAEEVLSRGRRVLVVGGSGFYLKVFLGPVVDGIEVPAEVRKRVGELFASEGLEGVLRELRGLNPDGFGTLDVDNPRRVCPALERCIASGRTLLQQAADFGRRPGPFEGWATSLVQIDLPREELERRIDARVDAMLDRGLLAEVSGLLGRGLLKNPSAMKAIGYRESIDVLQGRAPEAGLRDAICRNTRALVKKQRTWFRTQLPPHAVVDACRADPRTLF